MAQHRTGIAEVMGSNPVEALIFFQASCFQLHKLEIYCDDHSSLSNMPMLDVKSEIKLKMPLLLLVCLRVLFLLFKVYYYNSYY